MADIYEGTGTNDHWEHDLGYSDGTTNDTILASNVANYLSADTLSATGTGDTLVATPSGTSTLFGGLAGDALESGTGTGIADYTQTGVAVSLATGKATLGSASDTLIGITQAIAGGTSDALTGGAGTTTIIAAGASDLLTGGTGLTQMRSFVDGDTLAASSSTLSSAVAQAYYSGDSVAVNLNAGTATVTGSASDTLIGIYVATVAGANDTLIGNSNVNTLTNSAVNTLTAAGANDTLINEAIGSTLIATGADALIEYGGGIANIVTGDAAGDTTIDITGTGAVSLSSSNLTNIHQAIAAASGVTLTGLSSGTSTLTAAAANDTLIAAGGATQMIGDVDGDTLEASTSTLAGTVSQAYYGEAGVAVNLNAGTATETGSASDTLVGFTVATVTGANDTLTGSTAGVGTLTAAGANDTLINEAVGSTMIATGANAIVEYGGGTVNTVIGDTAGDTTIYITTPSEAVSLSGANLTNINRAIAATSGVTLTGNSNADIMLAASSSDILSGGGAGTTLSASGSSDTLIGGTAGTTLSASGSSDSIIYSGNSTTTIIGDSSTILGLTTANQSVNLGAANFSNNSIVRAIAGASYITLTGSTAVSALTASGTNNTLINGAGGSTLTATGSNDTLINGTADGSTLTATGSNDEIIYDGANTNSVTGDVNGSGVDDTTLAITGSNGSVSLASNVTNIDIATVTGSNETLIGSTGGIGTLTAAGGSDTLINGYVGSTLIATGANALIEYGGGTVNTVTGDAAGDTTVYITGSSQAVSLSASNLTRINSAIAAASGITLTGNSSADIMVAASTSDTLIGGGSGTTLSASGSSDSIIYGGSSTITIVGNASTILGITGGDQSVNLGASNFSGIVRALIGAGAGNVTLTGSAAAGALTASGSSDTLINGGAGSTLTATGSNDEIMFQGANTNIINGDSAGDTTLAITGSSVSVSLSGANISNIDIATLVGSSDTLVGSTASVGTLTAAGASDTLMNEYVGSTLIATGANALIEYGGGTVNTVTGDAAGDTTVYITGSSQAVSLSTSNLTRINRAIVAASSVTLTGNSSADIMVAASTSDTLIGGGAGTTLSASGLSDSIIYGGSATTVIGDSTTFLGVTTANVNINLTTATNISGIVHAIIHAQRGSCDAYILSQAGEGWVALPAAYDDGGYSGGTIQRPGLKQLLADITAGYIDIVVVYKVDRLTRSLADFARIVECFDNAGVSFVSVTQAFNTTTSMGRLTLNMLLSFAQFEREVTGERIRDKIAASKAKGLWMGGWAPLGYDGVGRKLEINEAEADTVRSIFSRYLTLGSVHVLHRELAANDIRSKRRVTKTGKLLGGAIIDRGALYHMLSNPVYRGCIQHRDKLYPGAHPPIVDDELWTAVQNRLIANTREKPSTPKLSAPSVLQGRLIDDRGQAMHLVHTKKGNTRYRYYASAALNDSRSGEAGSIPRIAVGVLDGFVRKQLADRLSRGWIPEASDEERIRSAISRLMLSEDRITITLDANSVQADLTTLPGRAQKVDGAIEITIETRLKHRKGEMRIECATGMAAIGQIDKALVRAVCLTRVWADGLSRGEYKTITEVAERFGYWDHHVANLMPLAWLAPDLVEDILDGKQPAGLTLSILTKRQLPMEWDAQRALFRNSGLRN